MLGITQLSGFVSTGFSFAGQLQIHQQNIVVLLLKLNTTGAEMLFLVQDIKPKKMFLSFFHQSCYLVQFGTGFIQLLVVDGVF